MSQACRVVMVVDDEQIVRRALVRLLEALGCDVIEAASGNEAIELCALRRPQLVITDLEMPGMRGSALLRRIRAALGAASPRMVVLTGGGEPSSPELCDAILTKPVSLRDLRELVDHLLG